MTTHGLFGKWGAPIQCASRQRKNPVQRGWLVWGITALCLVLAGLTLLPAPAAEQILLAQDAFDPLAILLETHTEADILRLNPYQLGLQLPGLSGLAFVFGTQARAYEQIDAGKYIPLYSATVVIAVNRHSEAASDVRGWRSLLESAATVLIPHHATEYGRLAGIAVAQALGGAAGDLAPAVAYWAKLQAGGRLNHQDEYGYMGYNYLYRPDRLSVYDAVVLWDYQAAALGRMSGDWTVVLPEEGTLTVDCGLLCGQAVNTSVTLSAALAFLRSEPGQQALAESGFAEYAGPAALAEWDWARLTYNADFRRTVLAVKRHGPASVWERLLLQGLIFLLFTAAAQQIVRRIPRHLDRLASMTGMIFAAVWLLLGIAKTLSVQPDLTRLLWFATYIPRHALPVCWYLMCFVHRSDRLPPQRHLLGLFALSAALSAFVLTNDLHRQVFVYLQASPASWANRYTYHWGYYLSLLWSFSLIASGIRLLVLKGNSRRLRRQITYAGLFGAGLLIYQVLYIAGVHLAINLEIPTTVAIFILVFSLAAQQERFMGALLLALPVMQNAPVAIAIDDSAGRTVYRNAAMSVIGQADETDALPADGCSGVVRYADRVYKARQYPLANGRVNVLEDITALHRLEQSLRETHLKLAAVQAILTQRAVDTRSLTDHLAQEQYTRQMDQLFKEKLAAVRLQLAQIMAADDAPADLARLRRARLLICICQQRLRLIIRSLESYPGLPAALIGQYGAGLFKDGQRFGIDAVLTSDVRGLPLAGGVAALLEMIDWLCLYLLGQPGLSLICRLTDDPAGIALIAVLSWEDKQPDLAGGLLPEQLGKRIGALGGQISQTDEEDNLRLYLLVPAGEAET